MARIDLLARASAIVAATGLMAGAFGATAQESITWRVQTGWLPGNTLYDSVVELAERIDLQSEGRLKIEVLPAGAVVALNQTIDSVKAGIIDGHISYAAVYAGLDPGFAPLGDIPGAYDDRFQTIEFMYYEGGLELLREAYAQFGLHTIGVGTGSWEAVPSRVPLESWDDFEGVKLRTPPGIGSLIWERLGAVPIVMPQTEVFSALEKGVIDAADDGSLSYNFQVGDYDIVDFTLVNSPHSNGVWDFTVNADRWAELPDSIKSMLEINMREIMLRNVMNALRQDQEVLAKADEIGLTLFELTPEDRAKYRAIAVEVWDEWATKSELSKKAVDAHKAFLTKKGLL
jgi:TRAP-type mannitol/chloroaromatic compound transport system substrate-binding protein